MGCKGCPQVARTLIAWMVSAEPPLSLVEAVAAGGGPFRPPGRL